ncbi:MAG: hypothetical protein B7C24_00425 [Bacteroidetes bacterium 4572_77]|nr:MAG: hypothetical protein B7C24_00425 [Bacteroidetes bacterium 4572_77]
MKQIKIIPTLLMLLLTSIILFSSCKQANQQSKMLEALENSGVEVPDELKEESRFSWADIVFPLSIVISFSVIGFLFFWKVKRSKSDIGYAMTNMSKQMDSIKKGDSKYDKMNEEEKKQLQELNNLFKPTKDDK